MTYTIRVSHGVDKVIAKWKKSNPDLFKKYRRIFEELLEHPKTGLDYPEPLLFSLRPLYSCTHLLSKYPDNRLWTDGLCPYLFNDIQPAFLFVCTAER